MSIVLKKRKRSMYDYTPVVKKSKVTKLTKLLKKQNLEIKFFDTTLNTTAITTTGVIINNTVLNIVEGSDFNNRVGRKITLTSIHFRGAYLEETQTSLANMSNNIRIIIYQDKQCNATAAAVTDILATADEKSFNNLNNTDRFVILKDWFFTLNHTAQSALTGPVYATHRIQENLTWNKKNMSMKIKYNGTNGGTVADLTSNNIGVLGIAQSSNGGSLDAQIRVRFSDN